MQANLSFRGDILKPELTGDIINSAILQQISDTLEAEETQKPYDFKS